MNNQAFRKDVLTLFSGSTIAALLGFLVIPVLTRFFSPEAFGLAAVFTSIVGIVSVLSSLRYEMTIVLPKSEQEASNMFALSLLCAFMTSLLMAVFFYIFGPMITKALNVPELTPILWLVPLYSFLNGIYTSCNYWGTRQREYRRISSSQISHQVSSSSVSITAGATNHTGGEYLVFATLLGKLVATCYLARSIILKHGEAIVSCLSWKEIYSGLKKYKNFPLYGSWSILLGVASWQLPILLLGFYFPAAVVGAYALGFKVLQVPIQLLGTSIGQVFFQQAVQAREDSTLNTLVESLLEKLIAYGALPTLTLVVIGKDMFVFIFGQNWESAGLYTQILSCWAFVWYLSNPFTSLFAIMDKQALQLKWNVINFFTRFLAISIGGLMQSTLMSIVLLSIAGTLIYGAKVILTLQLSNSSASVFFRKTITYLLISMPFAALLYCLQILDVHKLALLLSALSANLIYFSCISFFKHKNSQI